MILCSVGGANFSEAQETALEIHGVHALIFIAMTVLSLWFITAMLITIFAETYTNVAEGRMTSTRVKQWGSLTPIFYLNKSIECMDNPEAIRDKEYLTPICFEQIMLQQTHCPDGQASWLNDVHNLLEDTLCKTESQLSDGVVEHGKDHFESELHALGTVCAELQDEPQFQRMHNQGYLPASQLSELGSWADRHSGSCHNDRINMNLSKALVAFDICNCNHNLQLQYIKSVLGQISDKDAALALSMTACPLGMTKKNAIMAIPALLKIGHEHVPESGVTPEWLQTRVKTLAREVYMLDVESDNVITQQAVQLVSLIQLHKWRMLLLFQGLDTDKSGQVDLFEFEWLWAFATVGGRLASKPLLQDEAELMLLEQEIDAATDDDSSNDNTNAAIDLEALEEAHEKLQERVNEELGKCHNENILILQLSSLANLAVAAALADSDWNGNRTLFKVLLVLFPLAWAIEFVYVLFYSPTLDALQHPDKAVSQRSSLLVLIFGVSGSVLMICDQQHELTAENTQHAFASATVFLFITRNVSFSRMVLAFGRVLIRCFPLVSAIFMFMLIFCQASKDIFGDKVADTNGVPYFDTNSHSLTTLFRLFTGAGWHNVMLRAVAATTEAALVWFLSYIFLVTMFCCELFVGVIISEFVEIHSIESPRLFNALSPIFEFGPTEREAVLAGLLQLNRKMQPYNRAFFAVLDSPQLADFQHNDLIQACEEVSVVPCTAEIELHEMKVDIVEPETQEDDREQDVVTSLFSLEDTNFSDEVVEAGTIEDEEVVVEVEAEIITNEIEDPRPVVWETAIPTGCLDYAPDDDGEMALQTEPADWRLAGTEVVCGFGFELCQDKPNQEGHLLCRVPFEATGSEIIASLDYCMGPNEDGGEGLCVYLVDPSVEGWDQHFDGSGPMGFMGKKGAIVGVGIDQTGSFAGKPNHVAIKRASDGEMLGEAVALDHDAVTPEDEWRHIKIKFDIQDNTCDVTIGGKKLLNDVHFSGVKIPKQVCIGVCAATSDKHFAICVNDVILEDVDGGDAEIIDL